MLPKTGMPGKRSLKANRPSKEGPGLGPTGPTGPTHNQVMVAIDTLTTSDQPCHVQGRGYKSLPLHEPSPKAARINAENLQAATAKKLAKAASKACKKQGIRGSRLWHSSSSLGPEHQNCIQKVSRHLRIWNSSTNAGSCSPLPLLAPSWRMRWDSVAHASGLVLKHCKFLSLTQHCISSGVLHFAVLGSYILSCGKKGKPASFPQLCLSACPVSALNPPLPARA